MIEHDGEDVCVSTAKNLGENVLRFNQGRGDGKKEFDALDVLPVGSPPKSVGCDSIGVGHRN